MAPSGFFISWAIPAARFVSPAMFSMRRKSTSWVLFWVTSSILMMLPLISVWWTKDIIVTERNRTEPSEHVVVNSSETFDLSSAAVLLIKSAISSSEIKFHIGSFSLFDSSTPPENKNRFAALFFWRIFHFLSTITRPVGRDSIIENCTFENVNMGAVQVLGVADVFKEAIVPQNIVIKNTKFLKCWDDISVFTYGKNGSEQGSLKNVEIYNNFFYKDTGNTVYLRGSGDIKVRNNLFYETKYKSYSIHVRDSKNVEIQNNYTIFDEINSGYTILNEGKNNESSSIIEISNNFGGR